MKIIRKIIFSFVLVLMVSVIVVNINAASSSELEITTPKGTNVEYQTISNDLSDSEVQEYLDNENKYVLKGATLIEQPSALYNSHSYAWYSQDVLTNNVIINDVNVEEYIKDGSYIESIGNVGDILCFYRVEIYNDDENYVSLTSRGVYLAHSAIIKEVNGTFDVDNLNTLKNLTLLSKWGSGGLYEHKGNNHPYYEDYLKKGNTSDTLHFPDTDFLAVDNALFYVKAYRPNYDSQVTIQYQEQPYLFEDSLYNDEKIIYKLNIENAGDFDFSVQSNYSIDLKLFNSKMSSVQDFETVNGNITTLNCSLIDGVYYLRISLKNETVSDDISLTIERNLNSVNESNAILIDTQYYGTEVSVNGGIVGANDITEGFTRNLFLNSSVVPSISRLDYYWYSSDETIASVSNYGTVLAKNGTGNPTIKIIAVYKENKSIILIKELIIKDEELSYDESPLDYNDNLNISVGESKVISLPSNVPYNYNQYYQWSSSDTTIATVSSFGTVKGIKSGTVIITGVYRLNPRVKITIVVNIS